MRIPWGCEAPIDVYAIFVATVTWKKKAGNVGLILRPLGQTAIGWDGAFIKNQEENGAYKNQEGTEVSCFLQSPASDSYLIDNQLSL